MMDNIPLQKKEALRRLSQGRRAGPYSEEVGGKRHLNSQGSTRAPAGTMNARGSTFGFNPLEQQILQSNEAQTTGSESRPLFGINTTAEDTRTSTFGNAIKRKFGMTGAKSGPDTQANVFRGGQELGQFKFGSQAGSIENQNQPTSLFSSAFSINTSANTSPIRDQGFRPFAASAGFGTSTSSDLVQDASTGGISTGAHNLGSAAELNVPLFGSEASTTSQTTTPFGMKSDSSALPSNQGLFQASSTTGLFTSTFTPVTSASVFDSKPPTSTSQMSQFSFGFGKPVVSIPKEPEKMPSTASFGFPITPTSTAAQKAPISGGHHFGQHSSGFGTTKEKPERSSDKGNVGRSTALGFKSPEDRLTGTNVDIKTLKGLVIREIPEIYNKNTWLKRFYSRFGEVAKVICNPVKKSATVTFKTHEAAEAAKRKGRVLRPGNPPITIFWKQERKRSSSSSADVSPKQALKQKARDEERGPDENTSTLVDSDLQSLPVAVSTGEKFRTLDLVDKKIRQGMKKTTDIAKAQAVKGTCRDMCPEKERYMREDRRRLHPFEAVPGTGSIATYWDLFPEEDLPLDENPQVEHARAIKEYDRSAADKDEPLPHELRPGPVLTMTMDYLVTNVMDLGEGRWAEWFDFVWNRTRGIRKDITQQHLCDLDAVDLIEKTARFHIFCAHYLCEEDVMAFDPRINTENLTKCLQTLKHFYSDLYSDQNITCPCEAEFRTYEILLNLNEGDILREAMKYRQDILSSPLVKLATGAFQALNSNNFVRFFKIVKSSSYLSACILHRYFTQVRNKGLRTLNYSLSTPNKEMSFPLSDLVEMLAFEDEQEAADFCSFYGLDVTETSVIFMRGAFVEPEAKYPARRASQLIESKRCCSIGQVVYNGPLPPPPTHQPMSSFDDEGHYIGTYHLQAIPQSDQENVPPSCQAPTESGPKGPITGLTTDAREFAPPVFGTAGMGGAQMPVGNTEPQIKPPKPVELSQEYVEEVKYIAKSIFLEVLNKMTIEVTKEVTQQVHAALEYSNELIKDIEEEEVSRFVHEIAEHSIREERRLELLAAKEAALKDRLSAQIHTELMEEVLATETLRVAMDSYSDEQALMNERVKEHVTSEITQDLVISTVDREMARLVCETYREQKAKRKSALRKIGQQVIRQRTARYFKRWIKSYHALVHLKRLLREFPPHPPLTSQQEQLAGLLGPRETTTEGLPGPSISIDGNDPNLRRSLEKRQEELRRLRAEVTRPLDIPCMLAQATRHASRPIKRPSAPVDWKLVVSFPGPCCPLRHTSIELGGIEVCEALLREKFKRGASPNGNRIPASLKRKIELLSSYRSETRDEALDGIRYRICTMACYGVPSNTEMSELQASRQLQGTSALLVVSRSADLDTQSNIQELRVRIQRILQSKPVCPALPVLILLCEDGVTRDIIGDDALLNAIGVEELRSLGFVSRAGIQKVPAVMGKHDLDKMLEDCINWLAEGRSGINIKQDYLTAYVEEGLQKYFFIPLYDDVATRKKSKLGEQCPEAVVELYNSTIHHLAEVASSPNLVHISWPVEQFASDDQTDERPLDWNSDACLSALRDNILNYCIPSPPPGAEDGTWESEHALCMDYVKSLPFGNCPLLRRITWILNRKRRAIEALDFIDPSPRLTAAEVPWTQVLEACISSLMTSLQSDPVLSEMSVFYLPNVLDEFVQPPVWRDCVGNSKQEREEELHRSRLYPSPPLQNRSSKLQESILSVDQELDSICETTRLDKVQGSPPAEISSPTQEKSSLSLMQDRLGLALLEARREIDMFDSMLYNVIDESNPTSMSIALQSKKRKAESCARAEVPEIKAGRYHRTDEMPRTSTNSSCMVDDLARLQESIISERKSEDLIEQRLISYLET